LDAVSRRAAYVRQVPQQDAIDADADIAAIDRD
jgi:hypothetical protein